MISSKVADRICQEALKDALRSACSARESSSLRRQFWLAIGSLTTAVMLLMLTSERVTAQDASITKAPVDIGTRKTGEDWPTFLGPTQDSKSTETGILTDWSQGKLKVVWKTKLTESYSIGSISRGRFVQFDRVDDEAVVLCLESETGKELWKWKVPTSYQDFYGYNGGPRCSPVIDDERVYYFGVDGLLACLELATGKLIWKVDTQSEYGVVQNFFGVGSTPVVYEDKLLVMVGGSDEASQKLPPGRLGQVKGNGTGIIAFDKQTGKELYRTSNELASYASLKLATIENQIHCFAFMRGGMLDFDPGTGEEFAFFDWRARILESVNASTPVNFKDRVFISETYGLGSACLQVTDSGLKEVWKDGERARDKAMQTHWNTAIYHDGYLYGSSGRHSGGADLRCIDARTGEVKWSQPGLTRCSLLYVDGHFVVLGEYGSLFLIKATPDRFELITEATVTEGEEGKPQSKLLKYPAWAAPILSHGLLYVRGDDYLVCLELIPE